MTCPCCKTETTITFAQHLLHTYLWRFHDLYVCRQCVTYHYEPAWRIALRIGYIVLTSFLVSFIGSYIPFGAFAHHLRLDYAVYGTIHESLILLFEYVVYVGTNRRHTYIAERIVEPSPEAAAWKRPGFFKSLLHNCLGRYDDDFLDYKDNIYFRENHIVTGLRLAWLLLFDYVVCLISFLCIVFPQHTYMLLIVWGFLLFVFPLILEYIFYKKVPMLPQHLWG